MRTHQLLIKAARVPGWIGCRRVRHRLDCAQIVDVEGEQVLAQAAPQRQPVAGLPLDGEARDEDVGEPHLRVVRGIRRQAVDIERANSAAGVDVALTQPDARSGDRSVR